ncbi:uncharacterized protein LOC134846475 isoform X2 [Symsagittifera roscoffensis]|uniref:uncharacterized protein LOC134846475 isoform X2 n=1 Tax=Symsagittifera roscoffensis TaxID=84072 RepID=UPI00307BA106
MPMEIGGERDNQGILNERGGGEWQGYSFKYANFGTANSTMSRVFQLLSHYKHLILVVTIFLLIFIGFVVDFSHDSRLSALEGGMSSSDYGEGWDYDYSIESDVMVNIDVIGRYNKHCSTFFCPEAEYCYCLSKDASNFHAANQTCVEVLAGQLAQFKDADQEREVTYRMWRKNDLRKQVFWIGATKTKEQKEPQWLNCTECEKMSELDSHDKKTAEVTHGEDHSCLMMTDGVLQQYPCISPRLRNHEKKYLLEDKEKSPYWFDKEVLSEVYGLNALCECPYKPDAESIPSMTTPFSRYGSWYVLSKFKFLDQASAAKNCSATSKNCYLVSFESVSEQRSVAQLGFFKKYNDVMAWIGGKTLDGGSEYKWEKYACTNQDLDFGTQMDQGTKCYSLGSSVTSKWYWQETIHPRDCMDFQSSVCQIKTHALKAAKAAEDKQISLALIQHLSSTCNALDCITNKHCYCDLSERANRNWKEAMVRCGTEDMNMVVINDQTELEFLTKNDDISIRGYIAAHDFYGDGKLTWVDEDGDTNEATVADSLVISNFTAQSGCVNLKRGSPPFVLQNCDIPGDALCEFDVEDFSAKWQKKQDYEDEDEE